MDVTPSEVSLVRDIGIREPSTIKDPWELMEGFYLSEIYKNAKEAFLKNKVLAPDVSEKEKDRAFLESERAEHALGKFGTRNVVFKYDAAKYPQHCVSEIEEYVKFMKDSEKMESRVLDREQLAALDETKFKLHSDAAHALVKAGIAPSRNIGRALIGLILIDRGFGTPFALETTASKMRRKLGFAA